MSQEICATFFVAPGGNDAWSGKLREPDGDRTDGPFATPPLRPGNAHIKGMFRGNRFVRNIVCSTRPDTLVYSFHAWTDNVLERCDDNVFHYSEVPGYRVCWTDHPDGRTTVSFEDWQAMGFDGHSVIADPLFASAGNEDFRMQPDSPALALGFQPVDLSKIGIRRK